MLLSVAEEVPVPKEYPKTENPFDLQIEGIELTAEQKREAARVKDQKTQNLKMNMDAMINKLSTASTTQKINDFLQNDYSSKFQILQDSFSSENWETLKLVNPKILKIGKPKISKPWDEETLILKL